MVKQKIKKILPYISLFVLLIFTILAMQTISADDQFTQVCGGDSEMMLLCSAGDSENAPIGEIKVTPTGGVGFIPSKVVKGFNWGLLIVLLFLIFLIIFFYKRKKKCKLIPLIYDEEEEEKTKDLNRRKT